jgi:hypothetical protein
MRNESTGIFEMDENAVDPPCPAANGGEYQIHSTKD